MESFEKTKLLKLKNCSKEKIACLLYLQVKSKTCLNGMLYKISNNKILSNLDKNLNKHSGDFKRLFCSILSIRDFVLVWVFPFRDFVLFGIWSVQNFVHRDIFRWDFFLFRIQGNERFDLHIAHL